VKGDTTVTDPRTAGDPGPEADGMLAPVSPRTSRAARRRRNRDLGIGHNTATANAGPSVDSRSLSAVVGGIAHLQQSIDELAARLARIERLLIEDIPQPVDPLLPGESPSNSLGRLRRRT
jgi:hypothetical protein